MRTPPDLEVRGVTLRIGDRTVLDRVSLTVGAGEIVALTGASGSGKTTLLRVIAGIVRADAGDVLLSGRDVTALPTHRRGIAMVFQDQALFPHLDVAGNVAYGLRMARVPRAARRSLVRELLELVGLDPALASNQAVSTLSGGEAQRVALARALAPEPGVLLLDEPLSALDPLVHDRLVEDLRRVLRERRTTALHVTHDRAEAAAVADRVVDLASVSARR
jgi:thiamine transport system ATP-binding protein